MIIIIQNRMNRKMIESGFVATDKVKLEMPVEDVTYAANEQNVL